MVNKAGTSAGESASAPGPWVAFWLPRHRRSVGEARWQLQNFLHDVPGGFDLVDSCEVVVSELVTNAVLHARVPKGRRIAVRFESTSGHLRIEVHDASSEKPAIRRAVCPDDSSGRGLRLVEALSVEWGCTARPEGIGKIVWALVGPEGGE
ncbi:ATP-binding protein [Streptomyces sp. NRRL WC-3742]|uniref:ATP-binding protein n=1 Tax=Streptomyces sp. NRRL WC-3742 TaxID=1463934 RepID=UPI001F456BF0|nr:ATP-binding protein [Streptomyces sp. NRRL WC-3742]